LIKCSFCDNFFLPEKQMDFMKNRMEVDKKTKFSDNVCPTCARKIEAKNLVGEFFVY